MSKWAFVDLETTGGSFQNERIIEIGVILVEDGVITQVYETLVNPEKSVSPFILELTGIREEDLWKAPPFSEILFTVHDLLKDAVFVAHNARFDKGFLRAEFNRCGLQFNPPTLCTVRLSRKLFPGYIRHNLDEIMQRFQIECSARHRALGDAEVLVKFWGILKDRFPAEELEKAVKEVCGERIIPPAMNAEAIRSLPEKPGVYIFYDHRDFPLYIGKSVNIKDRVASHFTSSLDSAKEMKLFQGVHRIETHVTAGELGALMLESQLIKTLQPLHNRKLRRLKKLTVLVRSTTDEGYSTCAIDYLDEPVYDPVNILGMFRSKGEAEKHLLALAKDFKLCKKLLGLEKCSGECFSYQLKTCYGACAGREEPNEYNARFDEAFEGSRLDTWPYEGPISIEEKDAEDGRGEVFIVDEWRLLARGKFGEFGLDLQTGGGRFDLDQYKILRGYLRGRGKKGRIRKLKPQEIEELL